MTVSIKHVLSSVIASLGQEVLPHLEPATYPASSVRASLMLLNYVEQRIALEGRLVFEDNKSLRQLLHEAADSKRSLALDESLSQKVSSVLGEYRERSEYFDPVDAINENQAYQEILTQLIDSLEKSRADGSAQAHAIFRASLHRYLDELGQRDIQLVGKALEMAPV